MYVFQNMTQLWLKKLRRNCWIVAQSKIFKFIWNCDGCHFLNVKILSELFYLDIELLQMIFSITSMLQAVPVAWISTVLFAEHSTLLDFANRFSQSYKTVQPANTSEFKTITSILQAIPIALISTIVFTE